MAGALAASLSRPAFAQTDEKSPAPASDTLAPELIEQSDAVYPEDAKARRLEASVTLRLTIDAAGVVTEAEVTEPAGHGFDEAARDAALQFRFKPAERDGQVIAARILFRYVFKLPSEAPPPTPGVVSGTIRSAGTVVAGLHVTLVGPEGLVAPREQLEHRATSDATGAFHFDALAPGRYTASVTRDGVEATTSVDVPPAGDVTIVLELPLPAAQAAVPVTRPLEVTVTGAPTEIDRLQRSAEAVTVVDLRKARQETADLGEVLARTQGVAVQRDGGLGSSARFALNGLVDDQIRFFLDGVPLEFSGYPFGIANVPVNLIQRVDVYRAVVPIRLGADALGGAVNLITDANYTTRLGASYQVGSFHTHRVTAEGRYLHAPTGFVVGGSAFIDSTRNDYEIDVENFLPDGSLVPITVRRFHDAYRAYGARLEVGVIDRAWARRLLVTAFASSYDKELQHNQLMTVPYGEATYGGPVYGGTARYEVDLRKNIRLELVANYALRTTELNDQTTSRYDWTGKRVGTRNRPGELGDASHTKNWRHGTFARANLTWSLSPAHILRVSTSPNFSAESGDNLLADDDARDPLHARNKLLTLVSGAEYELNLFDDRVSNVLFIKDYVYRANSNEVIADQVWDRDSKSHNVGGGDALRFRFTPWLYAKASYEYATRLPRPDEVFGDHVLVTPAPGLEPEVSHNANVGPRVELKRSAIGDLTVEVNGFLRDSDRLILLLANGVTSSYQNLYRARGLGIENMLAWISPGRWLGMDGTLTWLDQRNESTTGPFKGQKGDRLPSRPYLFASWGARLRLSKLPGPEDTLEPFYRGRYVHQFWRGWESNGIREFKQGVDAQVTHSLGLNWNAARDYGRLGATIEADNVTDAKVFDNYGVQRPGRAFYLKVTGEI